MRYRKLDFTGLEVSGVGYGAGDIGKDARLRAEDDESVRALQTAIDLALNLEPTGRLDRGMGMRPVRNLERNATVADGEGLAEEQVQRLKAHRWVRNFYLQPAEPSGAAAAT